MCRKISNTPANTVSFCAIIFSICIFVKKTSHQASDREVNDYLEDRIAKIIEKAKKDADKIKRESLFETKEEIHKLKIEADKEIKEKKGEIKEQEEREIDAALNYPIVGSEEHVKSEINKKIAKIKDKYDVSTSTSKGWLQEQFIKIPTEKWESQEWKTLHEKNSSGKVSTNRQDLPSCLFLSHN